MSQEPDYIFGVDGKKYVRVRQGEYVLDANDSATIPQEHVDRQIRREVAALQNEMIEYVLGAELFGEVDPAVMAKYTERAYDLIAKAKACGVILDLPEPKPIVPEAWAKEVLSELSESVICEVVERDLTLEQRRKYEAWKQWDAEQKGLVYHPGPPTTAFKPVRDPRQNRQDMTGYWYEDHMENDPQSSDPLWAPLRSVDEDVRLWNGVDKRGVIWEDGISIGVIGNDGPCAGPEPADGEPIWDGVDANGILWENGNPIGQVDTDTVKWERGCGCKVEHKGISAVMCDSPLTPEEARAYESALSRVPDADDAEQRALHWKNLKLGVGKPNRLRGSACYLAGPMTACADFGESWRAVVTPQLRELGVVVLDPTHKPIEIGREDAAARAEYAKMKVDGDIVGLREVLKVIRRVDLRCIDLSSFIIVRLDGTDTVGTWEEIAMAVSQRKPTLIWLDGGLKKATMNAWLLAQVKLEYVFESFEDLLAYLKEIDTSPNHPEDHWWMLFDFEKLYREVLP